MGGAYGRGRDHAGHPSSNRRPGEGAGFPVAAALGRRVTLADRSSRDTEVTTNRKRTKKITVRDAEPSRTRIHHEQQRQGQGGAEAAGGSSAGPEQAGPEPRVTERQAWGEVRRAPEPAAVPGAAPDTFVIPELRPFAPSRPFLP